MFDECATVADASSLLFAHLLPLWNAIDAAWAQFPQLCADLIEVFFFSFLPSKSSMKCVLVNDEAMTKTVGIILDLQKAQHWNSSSAALHSLFHLSNGTFSLLLRVTHSKANSSTPLLLF